MAEDLITALRGLANRWAIKARDYSRDAKSEADAERAAYNRGFAEGYYRAATELAALLKQNAERPMRIAAPRPVEPPPPEVPARPQQGVTYASISVTDVLTLLSYEGIEPRDIEQRKDNSFRVVFSKWQNLMDHERVEKVRKADNRLIILDSGRTKDSNDPYIELAFKDR